MSCPFSNGTGSAPHPVGEDANGQVTNKPEPIPQPPTHLFGLLGNFPDMEPAFPAKAFWRLADLYGPIYQVQLAVPIIVVSSQKYVNEVCDQDRFQKKIAKSLQEVRALTGDGLFTAYAEEENWWIAHRTLIPAFGPLGIRKMFDEMLDISSQLVLKWHRYGMDHPIDVSDDFTRLAFDTIGLCAFGYRFNEFYTDESHPFAHQMANALKLSGERANRLDIENRLHRQAEAERQSDVKKMHALCREIVEDRKKHPKPEATDLLNTMLTAVDRETGKKLSEENIMYQMATFLVAGHETTSGTLSFMWYHMLKNPDKLHKAQQEVDEVVGDNVLTPEMLPKLKYLDACIKETLRLASPISVIALEPKEETYLDNGRFHVPKNAGITVLMKGLHHDPAVWGENHDEFIPERMLDGKFQALPPNSWKPFGNGMRACIGRGFAEQEMLMNTALILQRFQPELADPSYDLSIKSTLTIKPDGFYMKVRVRPGKSMNTGIPGGGIPSAIAKHQTQTEMARSQRGAASTGKKLKIYYGGNAGTCEGFAQSLDAKLDGIQGEIGSLDSATEHLSKDSVNVLITSSYEGKPPDNAKKFVSWLESLGEDSDKLKGVKYSVLGVGNSDWASTFHRIPKLINDKMEKLGAERITPAGFCDVKTDLIGPFDEWTDGLIDAISSADGKSNEKSSIKMEVQKGKLAKDLGGEATIGTVLENRQLTDTEVGLAKKHLEIRLPEDMTYAAGDYLVVQPHNPVESVHRVMRFFGFAYQDTIAVTSGSKKKYLPTEPTPVGQFLYMNVELATPVTKKQLKTLAAYAKDKQQLEKLQEDDAYAELLKKRYSIIDVLEEHHESELPFEVYIDMLLPMTARQYSISSSPLAKGHHDIVSITYDVHNSPALSGHGVFQGVCSTYLANRRPGDRVSCFVRPTNIGFRLPEPDVPVLMFAAGTGVAPMRAFLQERAMIAEAGARKLGPAMLFVGCRHQDKDYLYKDELAEWEKQGIVQVKPAFSKMPDSHFQKYVQDAIWENKDVAADMFRDGGKIYLCGSAAKLGKSCAEVSKKIYSETLGKNAEEAEEWLQSVKTDRYVSDVY